MKKFLLLLLSALLVLSFAACGGPNGGGTSNAPDVAGSPVAAFLNEQGDEIQEMAASLAEMMGEGSRVEVSAGTGNELIFDFFDGVDIEMPEGIEDALAEVLSGTMAPIFESMAAELQEEIGVDSMRITVRYLDGAGNLLAERSFDS